MRSFVPVALVLALATSACTAAPPSGSPTPPPGTPTPEPTSAPSPSLSPEVIRIRELRSQLERAPQSAGPPEAVQHVVSADAAFAFALYEQLIQDERGNLFFSPYSISTALSMTYAGARGATAEQLAHALRLSLEPADWHASRNAIELQLMGKRPAPPGLLPLTLEPTNAIFGQAGFPFEQDYLDILAAYYGAGLQAVDFAAQAEAARQAVNAWVKERTNDRIPRLLSADAVNELTRFVLVNAIYFKANWFHQFDRQATRDGPFTRLDQTIVQVPLMHGSLRTDHAQGAGWQALQLPYAGGASMLIIVPDTGRFDDVERDFDDTFLARVRRAMVDSMVNLGLPRWETASTVDLKPVLRALGVTDLFDPAAADLTGIAPDGLGPSRLFVTDALHQASVTVDEEGTEAAAATAIIGGYVSAPERAVSLIVDRPFLYLVTDDISGEILFVGRVLDPASD